MGDDWRGNTVSRSVIVAAVVGLTVLAGCSDANEPSAPPTSVDALTTTSAAPDVSEETTEAAPTSEAPEETETSDAPAMEQTEEGAEAFVEEYIDTLASVHARDADISALRALSTETCKTCNAFADAAEQERFGHEYMRFIDAAAVVSGTTARVETTVEQVSDGATLDTVFRLAWEGDQWLVSEIQASAGS